MLPDLSVVWVIFFVLLLTVVLDRLLFKPVLRVMAERARAIDSARELAERSATEARLATAEFERKTTEARAELYRQMDEMRRAAMAERAEILARTRAEAERKSPPPRQSSRRTPRPHAAARGGRRCARRRRRRTYPGPQGILTPVP